jgi:rSAM/selenodomain-associated transferase 1
MPAPIIIIFVKAPRPGFVKTRLATAIGDEAACDAYRQLTETVLAKLTPLPHVELRFTPDDAEDEIKPWLRKDWTAQPQGEGDLGQRMHRAFLEANAPAILIGSDCPYLELNDLDAAAEALQTHDAVFGPAVDGGYWLIGLNAPCPALFEGIEWSTDAVLKTTLSKADAQGLSVCQLRELSDVDTVEDWSGWRESNSRYDLTSEMLKYPPK